MYAHPKDTFSTPTAEHPAWEMMPPTHTQSGDAHLKHRRENPS